LLLQEKELSLERILAAYGRVAVAFSGGADSSLLLKKAVDVLGAENVLALTVRSCLLKKGDVDNAATWAARNCPNQHLNHEFVDLKPLEWDEFVANPPDRCYVCKLRVYHILVDRCASEGIAKLVDGTNFDDLHSDRPGLRALRELEIGTPLAEAGLTKEEVRALSRVQGLDTWDRPSASCLATRIPDALSVTADRIRLVEKLEAYLEEMGFLGCRVRLDRQDPEKVFIQVAEKDVGLLSSDRYRPVVVNFFNDFNVKRIFLDLLGR